MTRLALIVQDALDQLEWQDEITVDEAAGTSQLKTLRPPDLVPRRYANRRVVRPA